MSTPQRDPFAADQQTRQRLSDELYGTRLALWEAHESNDAQAALAALKRMYKLIEQLPDAQVLYVGGEAEASFVLPPTARQMQARWNTSCLECGGTIHRGDIMYWSHEDRACVCVACGGIPGVAR